jgi:hypothetical protein
VEEGVCNLSFCIRSADGLQSKVAARRELI